MKQLRVLPKESQMLQAFCKEVGLMQGLDHPNVLGLVRRCLPSPTHQAAPSAQQRNQPAINPSSRALRAATRAKGTRNASRGAHHEARVPGRAPSSSAAWP